MRKTAAVMMCAVLGGSLATSQADFVLLDDFESYTPGGLTSQSANWSAGAIDDATVGSSAGNQYLVQGSVNNAHTIFDNGSTFIADESVGTYFFRAYMTAGTHLGTSISPVDASATTDNWNDGKAIIRFGNNATTGAVKETIYAYNTSTYPQLTTDTTAGNWYNIWLLIDNTTGNRSYDVLIQSNDDTNYATQTQIGTDLGFRQGTADGALQSLFFRTAINASDVYFDDLYIDSTTHNLVNPIPEPATLGMIALFGGGMLFIRRRFKI